MGGTISNEEHREHEPQPFTVTTGENGRITIEPAPERKEVLVVLELKYPQRIFRGFTGHVCRAQAHGHTFSVDVRSNGRSSDLTVTRDDAFDKPWALSVSILDVDKDKTLQDGIPTRFTREKQIYETLFINRDEDISYHLRMAIQIFIPQE